MQVLTSCNIINYNYIYVPTIDNLFFWYTNGMYIKNADRMNTRPMRNCGLGSLRMGVMNKTVDTMSTNIGMTIGTCVNEQKTKYTD